VTNMPFGCSEIPGGVGAPVFYNNNPSSTSTCADVQASINGRCVCGTASPPPPSPPFACETMEGRINTQTLGVNGKWCDDIKTNDVRGGCEGFYSLTGSGNMRLCHNPIAPETSGSVFCAQTSTAIPCDPMSPSPPPPPASPPALPPPPAPPSPPPTPPPSPPPAPPLACETMNGRINTQTLGGSGKFCYEIRTTNPLGCEGHYSLVSNGNMRLCYNPIQPTTDSAVFCAETDKITCDYLPPSPPAPPAIPPSPPTAPARRLSGRSGGELMEDE
jgi:hypothetical protein